MTATAPASPAEQALKDGDLAAALKHLQTQVRAQPANAGLRVFLFQLLCVQGDWTRALNQLNVAGELDAGTLAMVQAYRETIQCEGLREQVFKGQKAPLLFGEPEPWIALLIEALLREGRGDLADGAALRAQGFEQAPATAGQVLVDGHETPQAFEWIADADMRLGPVLEAVVNGKYYWVPFTRLAQVTIEAPSDLRDRVWMPAQLTFANGGEVVAFLPTRYAGSDLADAQVALARKTEWSEPRPGLFIGSGQRMLTTEAADLPLMDVRTITLGAPADG
ncbi:type VI secretion system accessory protein TagJ [Pseudorhodoferax sp.]|uniref:type VI secretion system accessory protein TagJ n=1 Tax=Pseudorhodoferax sp. TaxID=1993553 RepID=UPI002DD69703|nr:type VI secretion system accessory protein TagJ [Pseudorhodoferax sp.]